MLNTIRELKLFRGDYIAFRDIDKKFLAEFTDFLRQAPKASRYGLRKIGGGLLSNNSVVAYYGTLRTAINRAYKEGIITVNPTKEFDFVGKVRQEPSRREYLTIDELKTLINTECRHEIVKRAFLFSCLCGLRVSDIRKLKWCDLQRSGGRVRIEITMQKTKEPLYLPISDEALKWLPERGEANDSDFIFPLTHERTVNDTLQHWAMERIREIIAMGTGCVEIKSGYGLTTEDELKMLRVIRRIRETSPITVRATFLGAHAVGRAYKGRQQEYVDLICREMIPAVGREKLAEFVDVFCDQGFFTVEETEQILRAGAEYGLVPKIHANELAVSGGVQVGVRNKALSVDHLERMGAEEIEVLRTSGTMPTMLPGAAFFLEMPYPPARAMIEGGLSVALASDFNPGSSPSGSMKMIVSLACIKMRMTPAEAINAATLNGAYAMGLSSEYGSITVGKKANFFLTTKIPSVAYLPYAYTSPLIHRVFLRGQEVK